MNEKVKNWIEHEFEWSLKCGGDLANCLHRCYGALMFALTLEYDEALSKWWDDEMRYKIYNKLLKGE